MKNLKVVLGGMMICSSLSFGQTNVIALKSQAGSREELLDKTDNFGLPDYTYAYRQIDSVKYVSKKKIVINYRSYGSDTTSYVHETDSMIQQHLKAIRFNNLYPEKTKFIGFPKELEQMAKERTQVKQNSISHWFGIMALLSFGGAFMKKRFQF